MDGEAPIALYTKVVLLLLLSASHTDLLTNTQVNPLPAIEDIVGSVLAPFLAVIDNKSNLFAPGLIDAVLKLFPAVLV